jgi:hypothetical protein
MVTGGGGHGIEEAGALAYLACHFCEDTTVHGTRRRTPIRRSTGVTDMVTTAAQVKACGHGREHEQVR